MEAMFKNLFYKSNEVPQPIRRSSEIEIFDTTPAAILWAQLALTQIDSTFSLIESCIENLSQEKFDHETNGKFQEERLNFLYQLLGTVIVEKNSEHFQRKIDIDTKLKKCKYRLEKTKSQEQINGIIKQDSKSAEENLQDKLNSIASTLQTIQKSNAKIDSKHSDTIKNIRKMLVVLSPKSESKEPIERAESTLTPNVPYKKQVESNLLHKLKTFQSFWTTIRNNLHSKLSPEIRKGAQEILQALNDQITIKLNEFVLEDDDDEEESKASFNFNEDTNGYENNKEFESDEESPFKNQEKIHTFETMQIARRTLKLKNKVKELLEDIQYSDISKYDKLRKQLDKCQDGFEEIESHTNPDIVTLRTETFDLLLEASKLMNERYEEKLSRR